MLITGSIIKDLFGVVVALVVIIIAYYKWKHQYWRKKNVPHFPPSIPLGSLPNPFGKQRHFGVQMLQLYKDSRARKWKHGGLYFLVRPIYHVLDPDYIRNIMTKDFQYFVDRGIYYNEKDDPISAHLFSIGGTKWRNLRMKLTPTFTSGKMKMMFPMVVECEVGLQKQLEKECVKNEPIDIKEVLACFTIDVIGSCAFGLECDAFEDKNSPFRRYGQQILLASGVELMKRFVALNFPEIARALAFTITPKDVDTFFTKMVKDTIDHREKNNVTRKDFMQMLIDLKNDNLAEEDGYKHDGNTLTIDEIVAQSVVFFVAGFETSSTTMTFALYELSKHQDIQQKLRDEINSVLAKYDNQITYEAIQDMKYMDQVIDETLRKYPPVAFLTRECVKNYKVPDEDLIIDKGTMVLIPIMGLHYDEDYYPDPEKFDPERFTEENKSSRHRYVFMPFGEGPRMCIGMRFGLMQSKVGLTALLRSHKFTLNEKTNEPLQFKPESFVLSVEGEIWLNVEKV